MSGERKKPPMKRYKLAVESDDYTSLSALLALAELIEDSRVQWHVRTDKQVSGER